MQEHGHQSGLLILRASPTRLFMVNTYDGPAAYAYPSSAYASVQAFWPSGCSR